MSGSERLAPADTPGPDELDALAVSARLHAGMGRIRHALALCELATSLAPLDMRFPRLAAALLIDASRGEEALRHLQRIETIEGEDADPALSLLFALALQSNGRMDEARERFARYRGPARSEQGRPRR